MRQAPIPAQRITIRFTPQEIYWVLTLVTWNWSSSAY